MEIRISVEKIIYINIEIEIDKVFLKKNGHKILIH